MKQWVRRTANRYLLPHLDRFIELSPLSWGNVSYSQEGEDMILSRFYDEKSAGFYVDIGAHHPIRFSNTYKFYRRGWNGLNVDATPGSMNIFRYLRPRDINIEAAIGSEGQHLTFYEFDEPALNTLSAEVAKERNGGRYHIVRETPLITQSMAGLLDVYVPGNIRIDFLSIDVEGLDCEVLSSNDWGRYRPELILAECFGVSTIEEVAAEPVYRLLSSYGYKMVAKTVNTVIFRVDA